MTTPSIEELISAYIDGELDSASAATVRNEIACSPRLQELERSLKELSGQLRKLPAMKPGRDLSVAIMARLDSQLSPAPARIAQEPVGSGFRTPAKRSRLWLKVATGAITTVAALILAMVLWNPQAFWGGRTVAVSEAPPETAAASSGYKEESDIAKGAGVTGTEPAPPSQNAPPAAIDAESQSGRALDMAIEAKQLPPNSRTGESVQSLNRRDESESGAEEIATQSLAQKNIETGEARDNSREGMKDEQDFAKTAPNAVPAPAGIGDADRTNRERGEETGQTQLLDSPRPEKAEPEPGSKRGQNVDDQIVMKGAGDLADKPGDPNIGSAASGSIMVVENDPGAIQAIPPGEAGAGSGFDSSGPESKGKYSPTTSDVYAVRIPGSDNSWNKVLESMTGEEPGTRSIPGDTNAVEVFVFEGTNTEWDALVHRIRTADKNVSVSLIPASEHEKELFGFSAVPDDSGSKDAEEKPNDSRQEDLALQSKVDNSRERKEGVADIQFLGRLAKISDDEKTADKRQSLDRSVGGRGGGGGDNSAGAEAGAGLGARGGQGSEAQGVANESGEAGGLAAGATGSGGGRGAGGGGQGLGGAQVKLPELEGKSADDFLGGLFKGVDPSVTMEPNNKNIVRRFLILSVTAEQSEALPAPSIDK